MDDRGFAPKLNSVEDIANYMLETRGAKKVGKLWAHRFVKRCSELKMRFNRVYDFQRALCEDLELIEEWFRLVSNMQAKYGIQDCDFYNFNETGFMMGIICPGMVVTSTERSGRSKAIQLGNREWATVIICGNREDETIPPFLVVQGQYHLSNWYTETFKAVYQQSITIQNIKAGFRGAGLIPFDPQSILSKLDVRIRTSTPPSISLELTNFWISQISHNPTEALLQSTLVKARIARYQSSSPTPIFETVQALAKGTERLTHEVTLLNAENRMLRRANEALSKRRRAKKIQLRNGGVLTGQEAEDILSQQEVDNQIQRDERQNGGNSNRESSTSRCCSKCGKTGHNSRTCQNNTIDASLLDS
ncbi:hypothetical protein SS1G_14331 [Sclerotinia sclerotiorum 1980 UF-70]|uniref:CCHC-type domain-containing protein n=1 Tax=Sclerotinia sclerotiorum (strain ATCC 18683 / 1980 / Ss-1) TaxID=665079 RepID=A7F9Q0_SCLS1|nr:hypothetical protein SS1G_14331 [Sclerotinia sclerotiorum 1980 UF-70]EDO00461.1 hypothetical protein SS1G_14331 [Sclerotinia sclerotiorum 1980 UF-70]